MKTLVRFSALLLLVAGCASSELDPLINQPLDPTLGTSTLVIHRPQSVGTRLRQQGVFTKHRRRTALSSGWVLHQDVTDLQIEYDVGKTLLDVDLRGGPKRMRYDVSIINFTTKPKPSAALGQGGIIRLHGPDEGEFSSSGGQVFDLLRQGGHIKASMVSGKLDPLEEDAVTDPMGPGYELFFEETLARMIGPKSRKRVGDEWDLDTERAARLLYSVADLEEPSSITGKVTFLGMERINGIDAQRVEAWVKGRGKIANDITFKIFANNNDVDVKYSGLFPVELGLPPVEQKWSVKGRGHMIAQVNDQLGDIEFETDYEHATRIVEIRR